MSEEIKIVMIDDEEDLCFMVKENLKEKVGYEVITTSDSAEAVNLITTEKPDVVLLDVVMPGLKGPDIVAALQKNEATQKIPVVIISGKGEMVFDKKKDEFKWMPNTSLVKDRGQLPEAKGAEALAEAYGVADYVSKPFTTDLLIQVINDVIAKTKKKKSDPEDDSQGLPI